MKLKTKTPAAGNPLCITAAPTLLSNFEKCDSVVIILYEIRIALERDCPYHPGEPLAEGRRRMRWAYPQLRPHLPGSSRRLLALSQGPAFYVPGSDVGQGPKRKEFGILWPFSCHSTEGLTVPCIPKKTWSSRTRPNCWERSTRHVLYTHLG